jgi:DNA helicase-2/ATP-dependent DNA helicase PcrA
MQDMDTHQYELLEKIFYDEGNSVSVIQRIGDKNQAIYNSVKASDVWEDRVDVLRLSGSQRLSKPIAYVVKKFALYTDSNFDIVGLNESTLKPHVLVFENTTVNSIIPYFSQIIKEYSENGRITIDRPAKIVCWNTDWKDDETARLDTSKFRLEDYHKGYSKDKQKQREDYNCLKAYLLFYDKKKKTLEPIRKSILNAFLKILRLEKVNGEDQRPYTKKKLIEFIKAKDHEQYEQFNLNIYNWSIDIVRGKVNDVLNEIRSYIPHFFALFSEINLSSLSLSFRNNDTIEITIVDGKETETTNYYKEDGLEIEITSVHAVKGQTHSATLYLESYFHQDGKGASAKSYESQRLSEQFLGNSIDISKIGERVKQSLKMTYVGFSRPTDLLCIAIHKERFDNFLSAINRDDWEIKVI